MTDFWLRIDWQTDWLIDWLIGWLMDWLTDWMDGLIGSFIYSFVDSLIDRLRDYTLCLKSGHNLTFGPCGPSEPRRPGSPIMPCNRKKVKALNSTLLSLTEFNITGTHFSSQISTPGRLHKSKHWWVNQKLLTNQTPRRCWEIGDMNPWMKRFVPNKESQDSLGFWIPPLGFRIQGTGFRILRHWN